MTSVDVLKAISTELRTGLNLETDVGEQTVLSDIGVTSMYLITLMITLKRKYGMNLDGVVKRGRPKTVGDLLSSLQEKGA